MIINSIKTSITGYSPYYQVCIICFNSIRKLFMSFLESIWSFTAPPTSPSASPHASLTSYPSTPRPGDHTIISSHDIRFDPAVYFLPYKGVAPPPNFPQIMPHGPHLPPPQVPENPYYDPSPYPPGYRGPLPLTHGMIGPLPTFPPPPLVGPERPFPHGAPPPPNIGPVGAPPPPNIGAPNVGPVGTPLPSNIGVPPPPNIRPGVGVPPPSNLGAPPSHYKIDAVSYPMEKIKDL